MLELPQSLLQFLESAPDAVAVVDPGLRLLHFNPVFAALVNVRPKKLAAGHHRQLCHEALGLDSCRSPTCLALRAFAERRHLRVDEVRASTRDLVLNVTATPLFDPGKVPYAVVEVYRDVTAESRLQTKYSRLLERERQRNDQLRDELEATKVQLADSEKLSSLVAESRAMQHVVAQLRVIAPSDTTVLITGETGTGKDAVARELHRLSTRADRPFVAINCAALPETLLESELFGHERGAFTGATQRRQGLFESAGGGTLFLDEIGETSPATQAKLLRVLEDRTVIRVGGTQPFKVDVRIIAATNRNLEEMVAAKSFRADLFYRLCVVPLHLPPLRDRPEDIPGMLQLAVKRAAGDRRISLSREALDEATRYHWPGNVRELINRVERAVALCRAGRIDRLDLPGARGPHTLHTGQEVTAGLDRPLKQYMAEVVAAAEKVYLQHLLHETRGALTEAAQRAGVDRKSIYNKMKAYGIDKDDFKEG